jgi:cell division protein FtsB
MAPFYKFLRLLLPIALLALAAAIVPFKVFDSQGIERVERLKKELSDLKETNLHIQRENEVLRREINAFYADPEYVEKMARDELGMVGPSEYIYQFSDNLK